MCDFCVDFCNFAKPLKMILGTYKPVKYGSTFEGGWCVLCVLGELLHCQVICMGGRARHTPGSEQICASRHGAGKQETAGQGSQGAQRRSPRE